MQILHQIRGHGQRNAAYPNSRPTANTGERSNIPNAPEHAYKPRAIRIPSLLSLFFLFVISFAGLELLLERTIKPSQYYQNHGMVAPQKRQAQPQMQQCPPDEENNRRLLSLRQRQLGLCSTYTTIFKPVTTSLPISMQTDFDSWLAVYSSMEGELEYAESCASFQSAVSSLSSILIPATPASITSTIIIDAQTAPANPGSQQSLPISTQPINPPQANSPQPNSNIVSTGPPDPRQFASTLATPVVQPPVDSLDTSSPIPTSASPQQTFSSSSAPESASLPSTSSTPSDASTISSSSTATITSTTVITSTAIVTSTAVVTSTAIVTTTATVTSVLSLLPNTTLTAAEITTIPSNTTLTLNTDIPTNSTEIPLDVSTPFTSPNVTVGSFNLSALTSGVINKISLNTTEPTAFGTVFAPGVIHSDTETSTSAINVTGILLNLQTLSVETEIPLNTTITTTNSTTNIALATPDGTSTNSSSLPTIASGFGPFFNTSTVAKPSDSPTITSFDTVSSEQTGVAEGRIGSQTATPPDSTSSENSLPTECTVADEICACQYEHCACRSDSDTPDTLVCEADRCRCEWDSGINDWSCGDWDTCKDVCSGPHSDGHNCLDCGHDLCTCQSGLCVPAQEECIDFWGVCSSCEAEMCSCQYPKNKRSFVCAPDECHCQWNGQKWLCGSSFDLCTDPCSGPVSEGVSCDDCETGNCICSAGVCQDQNSAEDLPSPTVSSPSNTITSRVWCDFPAKGCTGCGGSVCYCVGNGTPVPAGSPTGYCEPHPCFCTLETSSWHCDTTNLCAPREVTIPTTPASATTIPTTSTTTSTSTPIECDTSKLQCFGCDPDNADASCFCTSDGVCTYTSCPECEFHDEGTVITCPDDCSQVGKRSLNLGSNSSYFAQTENKDDLIGNYAVSQAKGRIFKDLELDSFNLLGLLNKRQVLEVVNGPTPIRDAWNYLLWTELLTVRRTSSSFVSTTTAATFTLDVFEGPSTSWPPLTSMPYLAIRPTVPACIPATLIAPASAPTSIAKRDQNLKLIKPYVTRESTTVVVRIRDNYLELTSNIPTITKKIAQSGTAIGALQQVSSYTMSVESIGNDGQRTTASVVVVQPKKPGTSQSSAKTNSSDAQIDNDHDHKEPNEEDDNGSDHVALTKLSDKKRIVNTSFTTTSYIAALYFPAIMAVLIKILFETMVASIKMMEPFERLHRAEGSSAEESLSSQYLSNSLSVDSIRSVSSGRSIPLWTLIIYILITIGAPLSSASMTVRPMDTCTIDGASRPCAPVWVIDLNSIRIMEVLLAFCMVLTLGLAWDSWTYHAGVPTNPTSIAAMAVLLNHEPLRQDLQSIEPNATEKDTNKALSCYHFWLLPHNPTPSTLRYGIVHSSVASVGDSDNWGHLFSTMERVKQILSFESRSVSRILDGVHLFTTITLLALLTTYRANLRDDAFNMFFASGGWWPKFIIVGLAAVIDMQWKNLEREVRIIEPYRRLYMGNARPENTILCDLNGTCWSNLPRCFKRLMQYPHMWFEALVGLTAILSDINIVAVSGVLMTYAQTKPAYEWSSLMALTTTTIMTAVLLVTMIWWRRTEAVRNLPRKPETVAAVLSYLCTSQMAVDIANMEMENLPKEERDNRIIAQNRRYRFGVKIGEDGKERYCVDYDDNDEASDDGASERDSWLDDKLTRRTTTAILNN